VDLVGQEPCPLPEDPTLAEAAVALRDAGHWGEIVDRNWQLVYATDDLRWALGFMVEFVPSPIGTHYFGTHALSARQLWRSAPVALAGLRRSLEEVGPWVLADTPGGRERLRELIDPQLHEVLEQVGDADRAFALSGASVGYGVGASRPNLRFTAIRIRDGDGRLAGTALVVKPEASMSLLATLGGHGDLEHFARMQSVAKAGRRPAAILFADIESSSRLARRLSTASYFALGRRMTRAADQCVIDAGGLTGRHVGDGVVAFFLAENLASESAAVSACIRAARALTAAMPDVAARSELTPQELAMRFGLHWGATLYVGLISTAGRVEVTALGDEVNEGARIEACATGGLTLASKNLIERLDPDDAADLELDPDRLTYTPLGALSTATEKARRDAPAIAVCEI
jgi:class 3 adenylate cyclase